MPAFSNSNFIKSYSLPILGYLANPLHTRVLHGNIRVETLGNGLGNDRLAILLQQLNLTLAIRHKRVNLSSLGIEIIRDDLLFIQWRQNSYCIAKQLLREISPCD